MRSFPRFSTNAPAAPRTVLAYHGCSLRVAELVLAQQEWLPSTRVYDWLGEGIYFWEYAPIRALEWARFRTARSGDAPAVLRATVRLGRCLNLLDTQHIPGLIRAYESLRQFFGVERMPVNTSQGAHYLDRQIIDEYCMDAYAETGKRLQTIRGTFPEGEPIYPGSKILSKAHTQIAVRDAACISDVRLVQW